jgi:VIT1/CCC1 family predicted Fe2+/Mn2+ transporter
MESRMNQKKLLTAQQNEINEYHTYEWLSRRIKDPGNRDIISRIARDELGHYEVLKKITQTDIQPQMIRVFWYRFISRIFGLSFGLRLMEKGEEVAESVYSRLKEDIPELADVFMDEQRHEAEILGMIKEQHIEYAGSMVLGLNDALMELTGALAGLTFALQNSKIIAITGFITGLAASMSMAASEYLSVREEADENTTKSSLRSAIYTGVSYIITVLILISPYLLLKNVYMSLGFMMGLSVLIILSYNFYIATAKGLQLWRRFGEMAIISLCVAGISFLVGMVVRTVFDIEV